MVFSNAVFLFVFLPVALLIYYSPICKSITARNVWLLFMSLGFYAWGEPLYIALMLISIFVNWLLGRAVSKCVKTSRRKKIVAAACIYNLGVLFIFKYLAWLLENFRLIGEGSTLAQLPLPIGISFYTFQSLSYVIDVYRDRRMVQKNILNVGLYIAFFPQLIAGPIVRYGTIEKQLREREHSFELFSAGVSRFAIGLSKKLLLANQLAVIARISFGREAGERSVALAWAGALAFMLQIYFDFSGYSDMAIGLGKMFGFELPENFNYPYMSRSITEYWRRWHISLGQWFRDYVYIPLGGNRVSRRRHICNILIVWLLTGIWHGANLTFVVWGMISCVFIIWEKYRKPLRDKRMGAAIGFASTFFIVLCTWVIFNAESLTHAIYYYASMLHLSGNEWVDRYGMYWIGQYKTFLIVGLILAFPVLEAIDKILTIRHNANKVEKKARLFYLKAWYILQTIGMCFLLMLDICYAVGGGYNPFIYFNF